MGLAPFFGLTLDLGIRKLYPQWKALFSPRWLREDLVAGITVAGIAVPLSLAIALASGVEPAVGLIAAIVGSLAAGLFGGTPLGVSGPAAAMAVLIASVVQDFGLGGLLVVGLGCGLLQLSMGVLGLGRLIRFVPLPVIAGFTAGIGVVIFIGQLPRALGLPPPDQAHVAQVVTHIGGLLPSIKLIPLLLAASTVTLFLALPRVLPRLPAPLVSVLVPSLAVVVFQVPAETIGTIPASLPFPKLPVLPTEGLRGLGVATLLVFALASLETLLSASAVDKLSKGARHDPDQELIGQGMGNLLSALFGGIPITGVIARSALNVQAGARTRRAGIIHGLVLMATVYLFAPFMARIPVAVLAGVLLSVALKMLHPRELISLWKASRAEAATYLVTLVVMVFFDLIAGVQAGLVAALGVAALRFGRTRMRLDVSEASGPCVVTLEGPLTFLSSSKLEGVRTDLLRMDTGHGVIMDISGVGSIDATGATQLLEIFEFLKSQGVRFVLKGNSAQGMETLLAMDAEGLLAERIACSAQEVLGILGEADQGFSLDRLVQGVEHFRTHLLGTYRTLFESLAGGQSPHTLFITCSDSRINPNLITSTDPGELFVIRNVGNMVPPFGTDGTLADGAGIEFAVGVLGVREIVLCGHSGCGAMKALLSGELSSQASKEKYPSLTTWLEHSNSIRERCSLHSDQDRASELNAIMQMNHLKTYPLVRERLASGTLRLHAWHYDIREGLLSEWDESSEAFVVVGPKEPYSQEKRMGAGVQFQIPGAWWKGAE